PHRFAFHQPAIRCGACEFGVEPGAVQLLRRSPAGAASARAAKARSEGPVRCGTDGRDSRIAGTARFDWRGISQDLGAVTPQGRAHLQGSRPALAPRASVAVAVAATPANSR